MIALAAASALTASLPSRLNLDRAGRPAPDVVSATEPTPTPTPTPIPSADITVDFADPVRSLDPLSFGMGESGYGGSGTTLPDNPVQQQRLQGLGLAHMRMDLEFETPGAGPSSPIVCGASGCPTSIPGDDWIDAIKAVGGEPVVIVTIHESDIALSASDAADMVQHFNVDTGNPVKRWIVWNEPDAHGMDADTYVTFFNQMYDAMKAVDPTIEVGGPATGAFLSSYFQTFLEGSGSRVDFIDFHKYGQGGSNTKTEAQLMSDSVGFGDRIDQLRAMIQATVPGRASEIEIQIGEWNLDWDGCAPEDGAANCDDDADNLLYNNFTTVWGASALGHVIEAGGLSLQFATKNGSLGALFQSDNATFGTLRDDPMPIYHATGMFTGESLFRPFGTTLVTAVSTLNNVEVYASDGEKNVVVVNKDPVSSHAATFDFEGVATTSADVWRKDGSMSQFAAPAQLAPVSIVDGEFTYTLPPYSVTTFVLASGSPADSDGDTVPDASDNCPAWPNPGQDLPIWTVPGGDVDCDGFSSDDESYFGTEPDDPCADDGSDDAWGPDFDKNTIVDVTDVLSFEDVILEPADASADALRHDLIPTALVDIDDVLLMAYFILESCTNP